MLKRKEVNLVFQYEQHADVTALIVSPYQGNADEYTTVVRIIRII